jgi:hypothetical protein
MKVTGFAAQPSGSAWENLLLDTAVSVLAPTGFANRELISFEAHTDSGKMPRAAVLGTAGTAAGASTAAVMAANAAVDARQDYRSAAAQ